MLNNTDTMKVFVYGTLKEGGYYSELFNADRKSSKKAKIYGYNMVDFGKFPGIIKSNDRTSVVYGELHEYKNKEYVMALMDRIEGYNGTKGSLFIRKKVQVETDMKEKATVYVFNEKTYGMVDTSNVIKAGVWRKGDGEM